MKYEIDLTQLVLATNKMSAYEKGRFLEDLITQVANNIKNPIIYKKPTRSAANSTYTEAFNLFWFHYPRKSAKKDAAKAWNGIGDESILFKCIAALEWQTLSDDWKRDNGKYIPLPATYLRGARYEDEEPPNKKRKETILYDTSGI